jgi:hypothetical protein
VFLTLLTDPGFFPAHSGTRVGSRPARVLVHFGYLGDMRSSGHQLAHSWFKARLGLTTPTSPKPGRNLQSVPDELGKALANRTPTGGTLPLFEARVGAGNLLATPITRHPDQVPPNTQAGGLVCV